MAPGTGGLASNTVVVAPGPLTAYKGLGILATAPDVLTSAATLIPSGLCVGGANDGNGCQVGNPPLCPLPAQCVAFGFSASYDAITGRVQALSKANGDDEQIVSENQSVVEVDPGFFRCADGSDFATPGLPGLARRFVMCGIVKPGPNGEIESIAGLASQQPNTSVLNNVLVPAGSGQKIEVTDPLNPDTDGDEIADGFERILGSSPNDPNDTGLTADADQDGLSDNIERAGWSVRSPVSRCRTRSPPTRTSRTREPLFSRDVWLSRQG